MRVLCLLFALGLAFPAFSAPVATVNGHVIQKEDLLRQIERDRERGHSEDEAEALERLVLYRVALQEAQKLGLHHDPKVREEQERILYQAFLQHKLGEAGLSRVSEARTRELYEKWPLVRLRHLALMARNKKEKAEAKRKLGEIRKALAGGADFGQLVLEYSQDPHAELAGGDLDFSGKHSLSEAFYGPVRKLKEGEVSEPVSWEGSLHLFQLTDRKPYEQAPPTYLNLLQEDERKAREGEYLTALFLQLKHKADIRYSKKTRTP